MRIGQEKVFDVSATMVKFMASFLLDLWDFPPGLFGKKFRKDLFTGLKVNDPVVLTEAKRIFMFPYGGVGVGSLEIPHLIRGVTNLNHLEVTQCR